MFGRGYDWGTRWDQQGKAEFIAVRKPGRFKRNCRTIAEILLIGLAALGGYKWLSYKEQLGKALYENECYKEMFDKYCRKAPSTELCQKDNLLMQIRTMTVEELKKNKELYEQMVEFIISEVHRKKEDYLSFQNKSVKENGLIGEAWINTLLGIAYQDENGDICIELSDGNSEYYTTPGWIVRIHENTITLETPLGESFPIE